MGSDYNKLQGVLTVPTTGGEISLKRQIVPAVKAAFEDWLELSARRRIAHLRKQMGETQYQESMEAVTVCSAAGKFRWGGEGFRAALKDLPGMVQMIVLLAREAGQELSEHDVLVIVKNEADMAVLSAAVKEIFEADPNFLDPP